MQRSNQILVAFFGLAVLGAACQPLFQPTSNPKHAVRIKPTRQQAFGSLQNLSTAPLSSRSSTSGTTAGSTTPGVADEKLLVRPDFISTIKYVFTGTPLSLTDARVNVLERTAGTGLPLPADLQASAGLGLIRFSALKSPRIENLTIRSGDEMWYVSPLDGTISMYVATAVSTIKPLTIAEPSTPVATGTALESAAAIRIANAWLAKRGMLTSVYGDPVVTSLLGAIFEQTMLDSTTSSYPISNSSQSPVVYPLIIQGRPVVQASGDPVGLTVIIDASSQAVTSLSGLSTLDFTSSAYDGMTDFSAVVKIAEQGGIYGYGIGAEGGATTTINLGTPDRVWMSSYLYDNTRAREIYVPALRFPVVNPPDGYATWIVVPLAKDLAANTSIPFPAVQSDGSAPSTGAAEPR